MIQKENKNYSRKDLIAKLRGHLEAHEIPHKFYLIEEIPYTQTMKVDRKKITAALETLEAIS